jgi:hypothetical protein
LICSLGAGPELAQGAQTFMRILVVRPGEGTLNGIDLQRFRPGFVYEMGESMATLFIRQGWGEPFPRSSGAPSGIANDRPRRPRRKRR